MKPAFHGMRERLRLCRGVMVDSNVLLDISTDDPVWGDWSASALAECAELMPLILNPVIYAEVSVGNSTVEALDNSLPRSVYRREPLPWEAGFLAGKCFLAYRRLGGARTTAMPDFYIGAHAAVRGFAVLTRDASRYRSYFPTVEVLSPQAEV